MTSWLNKQKKQALLELSEQAGLKQEEDVRKDDLIDNLDKYLQANQTRLARNASFQPYFDTRRTPFKARSSSAGGVTSGEDGEVKSVVKARGRRTTKVKPETDEEDAGGASPSQALATVTSALTPAKVRRRSQVLPASPADIADDVEIASRKVASTLQKYYKDTGVSDLAERLRERCSSALAVQTTSLVIEAYGLQKAVLPRHAAFTFPAIHLPGVDIPSWSPKYPDLFQLITPGFWNTTLLWASTSVFVPLLASYFFNLSVKRSGLRKFSARHEFDPLAFNVAKAILAYVIYSQGYTFGFLSIRSIASVNLAVHGGYQTMLIGAFVGIITALYEAAQGK